jgi:plastocyanin
MLATRLTAAALLIAALAGCGGPEDAAEAEDGRIAIELDDFLIRPQNVRLSAGVVTFAVVNRGRLGHNFRLRTGDSEPVAIPTLLPGRSDSQSVTLSRGTYKMLCTVANHEQLGMTGRLVVR